MTRHFNVAGPCDPTIHSMLPPLRRLGDIRRIVDERGYFVLHAPRQAGKTTALLALGRELTREGRYTSALLSVEVGAPFSEDTGKAERAILSSWKRTAMRQLPADLQPPPWPEAPEGHQIGTALAAWSRAGARPLVLFLDEIDALRDEALNSLLRQLRAGFPDRPELFPWSVGLIGMRDVRDYRIDLDGTGRLSTSSPFNIKVESLTLEDFSREEIAELYAQHTAETGQDFTDRAVDRAFELTRGQPWLVNALARQVVSILVTDRATPIDALDIEAARQLLVRRKDTHLDSLSERLRDPRIRPILEPMLAGRTPGVLPKDDVMLAIDLGLLRRSPEGGLEIANPIYEEIVLEELTLSPAAAMPAIQATWRTPGGRLDADALLDAFLRFWRQHGEPLLGTAEYHEVAPQLVMLAFLQRVVNGGGYVNREEAVNRGRMDLLVQLGADRLAIELKVWRSGESDPLTEGLEQLDRYLSGLSLETGWLVIFDQRPGQPPLATRTRSESSLTPSGRQVTVVRA